MSDTYSIIYSSEAKDDLREIYSYIAYDLQAPETAEGQVNRERNPVAGFYAVPICCRGLGAVEKHGDASGTGRQFHRLLCRK